MGQLRWHLKSREPAYGRLPQMINSFADTYSLESRPTAVSPK